MQAKVEAEVARIKEEQRLAEIGNGVCRGTVEDCRDGEKKCRGGSEERRSGE